MLLPCLSIVSAPAPGWGELGGVHTPTNVFEAYFGDGGGGLNSGHCGAASQCQAASACANGAAAWGELNPVKSYEPKTPVVISVVGLCLFSFSL